MLLVYRCRVKSLNGLLNQQSRAVNYVWNFCNDTQKHALKWGKKWPTGFDLNVLTTGSSKELRIHSGFLNIVIEVADTQARCPERGIGIDLGFKDIATLSTGEKVENPRHLGRLEQALAKAQRARKRRQATNLHARITNARRDFLHKLSRRIVRDFDYIAVGHVNAAGLAKTSMAKSVLDAGWSTFRTMLAYKAIAHGAWYEEVDERFTTQVCSSCDAMPPGRPKGIADLGIRQWVCSECGAVHDRDVNAALNILARSGHRSPAEGISSL
ncbi:MULTISPECIES: transposase [Cupriavidus]|uniref:RNA-guided endonuclease InsQ/TnpB family protein n=1 Tax=Cupriavidus TaxID=106589 RepID=UPI0023ED85D6|nr:MULTISPECIES: transposase [Cupriavidus]